MRFEKWCSERHVLSNASLAVPSMLIWSDALHACRHTLYFRIPVKASREFSQQSGDGADAAQYLAILSV